MSAATAFAEPNLQAANSNIRQAIEQAQVASRAVDVSPTQPRMLIDTASPNRAVADLRDIFAKADDFYDRGVPVRLAFDQSQGGMAIRALTVNNVVFEIHQACRVYKLRARRDGTVIEENCQFPPNFASMYLDWQGNWNLRPLNGIACSPLLEDDGTIHAGEGYDEKSGLWRENVPNLSDRISAHPTRQEAQSALRTIRERFRTFCFADASHKIGKTGLREVDIDQAPGKDESAFLNALLTAVCRPSLPRAPALLIRAAAISGAGAGKGKLARCISLIAFGREPFAVTGSSNHEEQEKRIAAELMGGSPTLFLDNLNSTAFKSDLLASAITERPARIRLLGKSQMFQMNATAFIVLTGNGLSVSEDLARRFLTVELDAGTDSPENRKFVGDIQSEVLQSRADLLAALLTIWRWGRVEPQRSGETLGSFEEWQRWVRDPLLALGCQDPAERVAEAKERDSRRQDTAAIFALWHDLHGNKPVTVKELHEDLRQAIDQGRSRQSLSARLEKLVGVRMAGQQLIRGPAAGKHGAMRYALINTSEPESHRDHRDHRDGGDEKTDWQHPLEHSIPPMPPMTTSASEDGGPADFYRGRI